VPCWYLDRLAAGKKRVFHLTARVERDSGAAVQRNKASVEAANVKGGYDRQRGGPREAAAEQRLRLAVDAAGWATADRAALLRIASSAASREISQPDPQLEPPSTAARGSSYRVRAETQPRSHSHLATRSYLASHSPAK